MQAATYQRPEAETVRRERYQVLMQVAPEATLDWLEEVFTPAPPALRQLIKAWREGEYAEVNELRAAANDMMQVEPGEPRI